MTLVKEISGSIKEKVTLLGQPAQLIKTIANKAVDMVLNFIITHPPSALIKAVFKGIEAIAGKSIVELIRQYIPYADKILDKIAGSGPVQGIMKPLEGPVKTVGGMIDQVTDQTTGMVDSAEKTTLSNMGSGAKLMTAMGIGGQSKNESKAGGKETGQAQGGSKAEGGGDIFGTVRSGIHNNLMTLGLINLKKLGMQILAAGAAKITGAIRKMLTPKVKFKLGNETHELWVEQDKTRNSVMMASPKGTEVEENSEASRILAESGELRDKLEKTKKKQNESQANANLQDLARGMQTAGTGVSKTIPIKDYTEISESAAHNGYSNKVMLGKYDGGGSNSYIQKAKDGGYSYFDLGEDWGIIETKYNLTDDDMFKVFNEPFLDDGINGGKSFTFSHNPVGDTGALGKEYNYLKQNGYVYNSSTMTMTPKE